MKSIVFRLDCSELIGSGHLMRCLVLAERLSSDKNQIYFVFREMPVFFINIIKSKNFKIIKLKRKHKKNLDSSLSTNFNSHRKWLKCGQINDALETLDSLGQIEPDLLLVDHYSLDKIWENILSIKVKKIFVIDDLSNRQHNCAYLLDQNFFLNEKKRYQGLVPKDCKLLLGPKFALLRNEFKLIRNISVPRNGEIKTILICFGGFDSKNYTNLALKAISNIRKKMLDKLSIKVIASKNFSHLEAIKKLCAKSGYKIYIQPKKIAALMVESDIAISAGGSTVWEMCSVGLPQILIAAADNQIQISKSLDIFGSSIFIKNKMHYNKDFIAKLLEHLILNPKKVALMSNKAFSLADGLGAYRACKYIKL